MLKYKQENCVMMRKKAERIMKFQIDHDYHIHTLLSVCSSDPEQTTETILNHAKKNGLKRIILTDHCWDKVVEKLPTGWAAEFYEPQDIEHIMQAKPLPQAEGVEFLFGCETEMDMRGVIGLSKERYDDFAFIIVPTTHMHMDDFSVTKEDFRNCERLAKLWVERLDTLLDSDLPLHKVGVAHLACWLIHNQGKEYLLETFRLIDKNEMQRVFKKAAQKGVGIEINQFDAADALDYEEIFDMFKTAKACGCKFYLGSDAHHPDQLTSSIETFKKIVDKLDLTEEDKFLLK